MTAFFAQLCRIQGMHRIRFILQLLCICGCKWITPVIEEQLVSLIQKEPDDEKAKEIAGNIEQTFKDNMCFSNTYVELRAALTASSIKGFGRIESGLPDPTLMYKESSISKR